MKELVNKFYEKLIQLQTIEELKAVYRKLVKKFHPDLNKGIDDSYFKALNEAFNQAVITINRNENIEITADIPLEVSRKLSEIIEFSELNDSDINIVLVGSWLWIEGNTYAIKNDLKSFGFKFSGRRKRWFFTIDKSKRRSRRSFEGLKEKHGAETFKARGRQKLN